MSKKLIDFAGKSMDREDKRQKTYEGRLDGKFGYMILTNKKILFLREEGFINKSYNVTLNLLYEKIDSVSTKGRNTLEVASKDGKYVFISEISVAGIENALNELIKSGRPVAVKNPTH